MQTEPEPLVTHLGFDFSEFQRRMIRQYTAAVQEMAEAMRGFKATIEATGMSFDEFLARLSQGYGKSPSPWKRNKWRGYGKG